MIIRRLLGIKKLHTISKSFIATQKPFKLNFSTGLNSNIVISKVKKEDYRKVADFLINHFYTDEPMGVALDLNVQKEVNNWLYKYVKAHLNYSPPVSAQAVDKSNGKLVGISFGTIIDPKLPRPPLMVDFANKETQPTKYKICVFLDEIEEGLNAPELLGIKSLSSDTDSKILDNLMIAVDKDYRGQGLAVELIKKSEKCALQVKDCLCAKVVVTSEYSYKAYLKREYQIIREFQYAKYKSPDGIPIFEGKEAKLGINTSGRVMIKLLAS